MSNELALQYELTIAKQQNELLMIKHQLQELQAQKISRLEDSLFSQELSGHYYKMAQMLAKSTMVPKDYIGKPENIFIAMAMGYQLGFPIEQSLQDIAVINGRPSLWGDGLLALALRHPEFQSIEEKEIKSGDQVVGYSCTIKRRGCEPHTKTFTFDDARAAGLINKSGPWSQYPQRMLQQRARNFAIRDRFADALRGLRVAEIEQEDLKVIEGEYTDNTRTKELLTILQQRNDNDKSNVVANEVVEKSVLHDNSRASETETKENNKLLDVAMLGASEDRLIEQSEKDLLISSDEAREIESLTIKCGFSIERLDKALKYFEVDDICELTQEKARLFKMQLNSINKK